MIADHNSQWMHYTKNGKINEYNKELNLQINQDFIQKNQLEKINSFD